MVGKIPRVAMFKIQRWLQWFDDWTGLHEDQLDEDPASLVLSSIIPHSFILNCFRAKLCLWIKENYLFIFLWLPGVLSVTRATSNRDQIICPSQFSPYVLWEIKSLVAPWLTVLPALFAKVPVGKLVCRLTESFTYVERNSWQRRQPCFQPAAHKTCRESIVSATPEFARIILLKTWSRSTFWVKLATDSSGYLNYTKCVFCCVPLLWDFNSRTVACTSPESPKVQVKFSLWVTCPFTLHAIECIGCS